MACEEIKQKLAQNEQSRKSLAFQVGLARDAAQQAYDTWQFSIVRPDQKFSDFWKGNIDGKEFTDPRAMEAYAQQRFEEKDARYKQLATEFNALFPVKEQLERDLQECEATQASTKENNSGTGTPGTAGEGADATKTAATPATVVPGATGAATTTDGTGQADPKTVTPGSDPGAKTASSDPTKAINPETGEEYTPVPKTDPAASNTNQGIPGAVKNAQAQATLQDTTNFQQKQDWRVRLSLSPGATYLYKDPDNSLLAPLRKTDGIIFPYVPTISVTYAASYSNINPAHSNYKVFQYENSSVDNINITCEFTAQDNEEAKYVLAVIHFLRTVTKMFYGQDGDPKPGTPPPLCYLFGMGEFQFNAHPLAITNFTYSLPNDVDYIRAGTMTAAPGASQASAANEQKSNGTSLGALIQGAIESRIQQGIAKLGNSIGLKLTPGGGISGGTFGSSNRFNSPVPPGTVEPTYVPTKIQISISAVPIISRYEISNNFSVKNYANGKLLQGVKRKGGGFW